jgi:hypothetical protein
MKKDSNLTNPRQSNTPPFNNQLPQSNDDNASQGRHYHHQHVPQAVPPSDQMLDPDEMFAHPFLDEDDYDEEHLDMILSLDHLHQQPLIETDYLPSYPGHIPLMSPPGVPIALSHLTTSDSFGEDSAPQYLPVLDQEMILHTEAEEEEIRKRQVEEGIGFHNIHFFFLLFHISLLLLCFFLSFFL